MIFRTDTYIRQSIFLDRDKVYPTYPPADEPLFLLEMHESEMRYAHSQLSEWLRQIETDMARLQIEPIGDWHITNPNERI